MKRIVLVVVLVSLTAAFFAQGAAARTSPYHAKLVACHTSNDAVSGSLEVDASITPIRGTVRMGLRFELYRRVGGSPYFRRASAPRLFMWRRSGVRPPSYDVNQVVDGLTAPAVYEMRVGFRWYGRHGRVLATRYRETHLCRQPDRRPDLRVVSLVAAPDNPTHYSAVIANSGATAAGPFTAELRSPGTVFQSFPVGSIPAHSTVTREIDGGPACVGDMGPNLVLDVDGAVTESNEHNNRARATCPA